jgi:hypothetical protein
MKIRFRVRLISSFRPRRRRRTALRRSRIVQGRRLTRLRERLLRQIGAIEGVS